MKIEELKLCGSLKAVPELAGLSWRERRRVHRACFWRYWVLSGRGLLGIGVVALSGLAAGGPLFWLRFGLGVKYVLGVRLDILLMILATTIGMLVGKQIEYNMMFPFLRPFYADYIRAKLTHRAAGVSPPAHA